MSEVFDAYHKWLGIPPREQPPDHYRLLGVCRFESDLDVIEHAADQRMAHVRSFQSGPHAKQSQRLLNELSSARRKLLDSDWKAKHDKALRATLKVQEPGVAASPPPPGQLSPSGSQSTKALAAMGPGQTPSEIRCPSCSQPLTAEPTWIGRRIVCSQCSHHFVCPSLDIGIDGTPPTPDVRVADSPSPVPQQAVVFEPVDDPLRRDRNWDSDPDYFAHIMGDDADPTQPETTDDLSESSWTVAKRVTLRPKDEPDGRIGRKTSALPNEPAATSPIADRIRRCPYCGEEILAVAKKCKHCLEFLDGRSQQERMRSSSQQHQNQTQGTSGCTLIILIVLGIVLGVVFLSFL